MEGFFTMTEKKSKTVKATQKKDKSPKKAAKKGGGITLVIADIADLSHSKSLYEEWKKQLKEKPNSVAIDCSSVSRITTPIMQLIIVFADAVEKSKAAFLLKDASEIFSEAMTDLGLSEEYQKWSA